MWEWIYQGFCIGGFLGCLCIVIIRGIHGIPTDPAEVQVGLDIANALAAMKKAGVDVHTMKTVVEVLKNTKIK